MGDDIREHLDTVARKDMAGAFIIASLANTAKPHSPGFQPFHEPSSVRSKYRGQEIAVDIVYTIRVNGATLHVHLEIDKGGRLSSHALPYTVFDSPIALVERFIDVFPELFRRTGDHQSHEGDGG